ncbi:hypothetical protein [Listeria booriae]|uniref:Uncharacterized protein n=1 Tax=Listeria booriae TaxID=1552123 RepID=A0A7X1DTG7_9LIST|nr:hypothetical protein [Listeria booriae]MBC1228814.1 hypothetical protein [Listeria booriae]MBC1333467.1 hypothetical protein [Listeria booriae]MBC2373633.1 hypothetical protein [Listeria booriae]MBC2388772.1 hypothetical protein [Listeria booriae]
MEVVEWGLVLFCIVLLILLVFIGFLRFTKPTEDRAATVIYNHFEKSWTPDQKPEKFEIVSVTAIKEGMFSVIVGDYGYSVTLNKYYTKVVDVMAHGLIPSIRDQRAFKAIEGLLLRMTDQHKLNVKLTYDRDHVYILELNEERLEILFDEEYKTFLMTADKIPPVVEREIRPCIEPWLREQRAMQAVVLLVAGMKDLKNSDYRLTYDRRNNYTLAIDGKQYEVLFNADYTQVEQLRDKRLSAEMEVDRCPEDGSQT